MFIPAELLNIVDLIDKKDPRRAIRGVCVECTSTCYKLTATDGRRLITVARPDAPKPGTDRKSSVFTCPADNWAVCQRAAKGAEGIDLRPPDSQGRIVAEIHSDDDDGCQVEFQKVREKYPNYRAVLPSRDELLEIRHCVNPELLGKLLLTISKMYPGCPVEIAVCRDDSPMVLRIPDNGEFMAVFTLCKVDGARDDSTVPETEKQMDAFEDAGIAEDGFERVMDKIEDNLPEIERKLNETCRTGENVTVTMTRAGRGKKGGE